MIGPGQFLMVECKLRVLIQTIFFSHLKRCFIGPLDTNHLMSANYPFLPIASAQGIPTFPTSRFLFSYQDPSDIPLSSFKLPEGLDYQEAPEGKTLNQLMKDGEIDGLIGPRPPGDFYSNSNYGRLFPDTFGEVAKYYNDTQIFPIMHVLGIKKTLVEQYPWLPASLYKAFEQAREIALEAILDTSASKMTLPMLDEQIDYVRQNLGPELWTYGFSENQHVIDTFLRYHHEQGLSTKKLNASELFHPSSMESYSL